MQIKRIKQIIKLIKNAILFTLLASFSFFFVLTIAELIKSMINNPKLSPINHMISIVTSADYLMLIALFAIIVLICTLFVVYVIIKQTFENEVYFDLDKELNGLTGNNGYLFAFQLLNVFYSENGKLNEIYHNNDLELLEKRKEFLNIDSTFSESYASFLVAVVTSAITSYMLNTFMGDKSDYANQLVTYGLFILSCFFCVHLRSLLPKNMTYNMSIRRYEINLIDNAIATMQRTIKPCAYDAALIQTKADTISTLKRLRESTSFFKIKTKKRINADLKKVQNMPMLRNSYANYGRSSIILRDMTKITLLTSNNHSSDIMDDLEDEYAEIYSIFEKYDLIQK